MSKKVKIQATGEDRPLRTCNSCKWVYFGVSKEYAVNEINRFNEYFDSLSKKQQKENYGECKSTLKHYLFCRCGNPYFNFRKFKDQDCPIGCTINPIMYEPEEEKNARNRAKEKQKQKSTGNS